MKPEFIWKSKFLSDILQGIYPEFTLVSISDDKKKVLAAVIWKEVEKRLVKTGFIFKTKKIVEIEIRKCYLCVFDAESGNILQNHEITIPMEIPDELMDVAITDDGELVVAGCHYYSTRNIFCYKEGGGIMAFEVPSELSDRHGDFKYDSVIISRGGANVLVYVNYYLCIFNIKKGFVHYFLIGGDCDKFVPAKKCEYIAYKADHHAIYFRNYYGHEIWSIGHPYLEWVKDLALSKNGGYLLVWTDSEICLFDRDGKELWKKSLRESNIPVSSKVVVTDNGETLVASGKELYFLNKKGDVIWSTEFDEFIEGADISRDGGFIALIDNYKNVYVMHTKPRDLRTINW